MRYHFLLILPASVAALGACSDTWTNPTAPPAIAAAVAATGTPATFTDFAGFSHFCSSTPPENVNATNGGTLHLTGARNQNLWITGNPLIDGVERNVVDGNINLKTGTGVAHLQVSISPDAVDGTWEIRQTLDIGKGRPANGYGVGHGTGELQGMTIKFTTEPAGFGHNTCNANQPSVRLQGVIIAAANNP